jgi:myxalamid-type nonribosomal peptide synthetase MxaA
LSEQARAFHVSFPQQRLYFLDALDPGTPAYNVPMVSVELHGPVDLNALSGALDDLVERHEILRTTFTRDSDDVQQLVAESGRIPVDHLDVSARDHPAAVAQALVQELLDGPMSIRHGPLARALLIMTGPQSATFAVVMHHLICDGWSSSIFRRELSYAYRSRVRGWAPDFPPLALQYADFAHWQRSEATGTGAAGELDWWRRYLSGMPKTMQLVSARPRSPGQAGGDRLVRRLPADVVRRIADTARGLGATTYHLLLTAFALVLSWFGDQQRMCIGTPVANRLDPRLEELIGYFANTVVVAVDPGGRTFAEALARVREQAGNAFAHQDVPFEQLVGAISPPRHPQLNPIFQHLFALHNFPAARLEFENVSVRDLEIARTRARFDLALDITETDGSMRCVWEFDTSVLDRAQVEQVAEAFDVVAELAGIDPGVGIQRLRERGLAGPPAQPAPPAAATATACLGAALLEQATRHPERAAVVCGDHALTYHELIARARRWAGMLSRHPAAGSADAPIAICLPRGLDAIVAMVAVQLAGRTYLPLEPRHPVAHRAGLIRRTGTHIVVSAGAEDGIGGNQVWVVRPEQLDTAVSAALAPRADVPAYVMFTSGSTGQPKGVVVEQRSVTNLVAACRDWLGWPDGTVFSCIHSFAFDLSVWEIYAPLLTGGTLVVASEHEQGTATGLAAMLGTQQVNVVSLTPTMLTEIAKLWERGGSPPDLRTVISGGEALPASTARAIKNHAVALWNFYGPTEATVWTTVGRVYPDQLLHSVAELGTALAGTSAVVLDEQLRPLRPGVPGQLHISGVGLARCYHRAPELTAAAFVEKDGVRWYRTGDICVADPAGGLRFLGRLDDQVKIRGHRVELAEVEAALMALPGVEAGAAAVGTDREPPVLVAQVMLAAAERTAPGEAAARLVQQLRQRYPAHLVPDTLTIVPSLPRTSNGKIDRTAVAASPVSSPAPRSRAEPLSKLEATVVGLWREILDNAEVGPEDDFFVLGGHSLLALRLVDLVNQRFGLGLSLADMFTVPTPAAMAQALQNHIDGVGPAAPSAGPLGRTGIDITLDAVLARDIRPHEKASTAADSWFVTGATGFLGAHVVHEVLAQGARRVRCLVRASDVGSARGRLAAALRHYQLLANGAELDPRIEVLAGDLGAPGLGIGGDALSELADNLDVIVHAGAWVNMAYPYSILAASNVAATHGIIRLAAESGSRLVHISSLSVLGGQPSHEEIVVNLPPQLSTGYAESKWVADRLVGEAIVRGIPASIVRAGRLFASTSGAGNAEDLLIQVLALCQELRLAPSLDIEIRLLPVDQAASAVGTLARAAPTGGHAYHLIGADSISWHELTDRLFDVQVVPFARWLDEVRRAAERPGWVRIAALLDVLSTVGTWSSDPDSCTKLTDAALGHVRRGGRRSVHHALGTAIRVGALGSGRRPGS